VPIQQAIQLVGRMIGDRNKAAIKAQCL
jgi:hypothetical protein